MDGILKVTPEQLISTSGEFGSIGSTVRNLTTEMIELVNSLQSIWEGEAATMYHTKFMGLQDDIEHLHGMIQEHVNDLGEMATNYMRGEEQVKSMAEALASDVIV